MKVVLIGVGQAGGKVTEALAAYDYEMGFGAVRDAFAVNTAEADVRDLEIDATVIGRDRVKGHGVGGDNELGARIMSEAAPSVMDEVGARVDSDVEALFVVAGLGGGTGSGGAPALARELRRVYDLPVYALGILPGRDEGSIYQVNAGRSLKTVIREADAALLVDNDAWRQGGESVVEGYEHVNREIAQRVGLLFAAGEPVDGVGESVVDSSEIINTLRDGGVASVGYASGPAHPDAGENVDSITSLTRQALLTGMSLPDAVAAEAGLLVVAGDPDRIARKGVERARRWVEEETGSRQVRGGDFPLESDHLASLVLLGGVERSPRLQEFMDRASRAQAASDDRETDAVETFQNDELEDLF